MDNFTMRRPHVYQEGIEIFHDFSTNLTNPVALHVLKTKIVFKLFPIVGYGVVLQKSELRFSTGSTELTFKQSLRRV